MIDGKMLFIGFDDHVVHIYFEHLTDFFFKYIICHSLVCCTCVFQTKRHDVVSTCSMLLHESGLVIVFFMQGSLSVSEIGIHEQF